MEQINAQLEQIKESFVKRIYKACPGENQACIDFRNNRGFFETKKYYWPDEAVIKFIKQNRQNRNYNRKLTITKQNQVLVKIIDTWASKTK